MAYTPQQWHDDTTDSPYGPISGDRLNYIEAGIQAAAAAADAAGTASGGGSVTLGTAAPIIDGVAAAGTSGSAAHEDHVHPTDTSRAALASPTFSGTPSLPTASVGVTQSAADSSTKLATTAFVTTADNLKANIASPTFTGTAAAPTASAATSTTQLATTAFVTTADNLKAPLASPTFTGTATIPNIAGPTTFTGTVTLSASTVLSGAPGDHVILASDNTLTTEADYVDVLPSLDNGVLMGMSTGGAVWTERVLPVPARRRGYLGWSLNPTMNGGGAVNVSTTPMLASIEIEQVGTISHLDVVVTTLGTTLTSGQCLVGVYRLRSGGSGTADLIALSADQGTAWVSGTGSTGTKHIAVSVQGTASLACAPGDVVYGAILANGTTPPQFGVVGGSTGATMTNAGLTLPDFKAGTFTTGQTTLPSTMNFTSGITTIGTSRFFGVS